QRHGQIRQDQVTADRVFELAYIAGPAKALEGFQKFSRNLIHLALVLIAILRNEMRSKHRNVFPPLTQWGHFQGNDVEPEIEILAKFPFCDSLVQPAIGQGENPGLNAYDPFSA